MLSQVDCPKCDAFMTANHVCDTDRRLPASIYEVTKMVYESQHPGEAEGTDPLTEAAPELLRQLKALVGQIEASNFLLVPSNVRAIIAKAEGRG